MKWLISKPPTTLLIHHRQFNNDCHLFVAINSLYGFDEISFICIKYIRHIFLWIAINHRKPCALNLYHQSVSFFKLMIDWVMLCMTNLFFFLNFLIFGACPPPIACWQNFGRPGFLLQLRHKAIHTKPSAGFPLQSLTQKIKFIPTFLYLDVVVERYSPNSGN
jgi:hypothetical protein